MTSLKPIFAVLAGAAIGAISLGYGFPIEDSLLRSLGRSWPEWVDERVPTPLPFLLMIAGACLAGRFSGVRPLAWGRSPVPSGMWALSLGVALVGIGGALSVVSGNGSVISTPGATQIALSALLGASLFFFIQSAAEEILLRGWVQPIVARYWGDWAAITVSAALFMALHNLFGVYPAWVNLNLFLGGIVFGLLYRLTGGIAAPIMFHFGWNWADAIFFGLTPNPGKLSFGSVFDIDVSGPAQLGGVGEGLMASIFATLLLVLIAVSAVLMWRWGLHKPLPGHTDQAPAGRKTSPTAKTLPPTGTEDLPKPGPSAPAVPADTPATLEPVVHQPATIFMPGEMPAEFAQPVVPTDEDDDRTMLALDGDLPPPAPSPEPASTGAPSRIQSATHEGCVRKVNEDRFLVDEAKQLYVVADGMGGHKFGDRASTMIVDHVRDSNPAASLESRISDVENAILTANQNIFAEAQTNGSRMGSTVVALMIEGEDYAVLWAGDSRAYRWRDGDIQRLTKDHTQVQEMVDKGVLAPEDVARHPMSHVLVRAVGVNPDFKLDTVRGKIEAGDVYFLCSDGIYDVLEEDEIGALLAKAPVSNAMEKMIKMSLDLGARDNVTGIIVMPELSA